MNGLISFMKQVAILILIMSVNLLGQIDNEEITKDEIIKNAWKAMFGKLKNEDIKSIYIEGYFHGREVPNRTTIKRPNLFRNEVSTGILVYDGKRAAWAKREPDEKGNPRNPEMIDSLHWLHFEVDIALYFPAYFEYPSEYRGIEKVNDSEAHVLFVHLPSGANMVYYVDAESFLISKRISNYSGDMTKDLWENIMTKYADYDGIKFPGEFIYTGRNGEETGVYKNVKFNINHPDELFAIPKELLN